MGVWRRDLRGAGQECGLDTTRGARSATQIGKSKAGWSIPDRVWGTVEGEWGAYLDKTHHTDRRINIEQFDTTRMCQILIQAREYILLVLPTESDRPQHVPCST